MQSSLQKIKSYTPPKLHTGLEWYISFYAFDPVKVTLRRKRIKINFIDSLKERRKYARDLMNRLSANLSNGWNPWIEAEHSNSYLLFKDVLDSYRTYITKLTKDGSYREEYLNDLRFLLRHEVELLNEGWFSKEDLVKLINEDCKGIVGALTDE